MARSWGARDPEVPGDGGALDAEQVRAVLLRAVERHCPPELASHREDFVQAAVVRLLERSGGEGLRGLRASYLWRVAFTVVIDEIRRWRRQQRQAASLSAREKDPPVEPADIQAEILACLGQLQERRRVAVTLHLQGFAVGEVASALGWTEKQAENLVYRGMWDLRRCLGGGEP